MHGTTNIYIKRRVPCNFFIWVPDGDQWLKLYIRRKKPKIWYVYGALAQSPLDLITLRKTTAFTRAPNRAVQSKVTTLNEILQHYQPATLTANRR